MSGFSPGRLSQIPAQPCLGQSQIVTDDVNRTTERIGYFLRRHASEVAEFNKFGEFGILSGQRFECSVELQNFDGFESGGRCQLQAGQRFFGLHFLTFPSAALSSWARPRVVHENLAHDSRRNGEEMRAVIKLALRVFGQFQIGFIEQCGRLQGVIGPFTAQMPSRNAMQVAVQRLD